VAASAAGRGAGQGSGSGRGWGGEGRARRVTMFRCGLEVHAAIYREALGPLPVFLPAVFGAPSAAILALEGSEAMLARGADDPSALVPIYVRAADAKLPDAKLPDASSAKPSGV